jgi:hypothetical protein
VSTHLFMPFTKVESMTFGGAGWARNTLPAAPAAPGGVRGQGEPVGLVPGTRRCQATKQGGAPGAIWAAARPLPGRS